VKSGWPNARTGCVVLFAATLVALLLGCGLAGLAVRQGVIDPPPLAVALGPLELHAVALRRSDCAGAFPCGAPRLGNRANGFYVFWIELHRPEQWGEDGVYYRLVALPSQLSDTRRRRR
jgi:hypothetical protein